jgi:phage gp45-like
MKTRTIVLMMVLCILTLAVSFAAENPNMGTWKLNEAKSKFSPGATKNTTVVYEAAGDNVKVTTDGTSGDGKTVHTEWTGKFDGKDYPVTGSADTDSREYTQVNANTTTFANKKDGKVTLSGKIVVAADGKSRTVTVSSTDASGKKATSTAVYDKQ